MTIPVQINDTGEFIAAVPGLMGFTPSESVVIVTFTGDTRATVDHIMRIDLSQLADTATVMAELHKFLGRHAISSLITVVTGGATSPDPTGTDQAGTDTAGVPALPYQEFVTGLRRITESLGVVLAHAVWVDRIEHGQTWRCYDDPACAGAVPDPRVSPLTVAKVAAGEVTYASREALAAQLAADPHPDLHRRAALLRELPPVQPGAAVALIRDTIDQIDATTPTTESRHPLGDDTDSRDDRVVRLAHALTHPAVRDVALEFALTHPAAAEQLWTLLTRSTPRPEMTHPATLLAISAALRGDGALANIAVATALVADTTNRTAHLLLVLLAYGVTPVKLRQFLTESAMERLGK